MNNKLKHWSGFAGIFGLGGSRVLEFASCDDYKTEKLSPRIQSGA